ncbi:hypothetical protein DFH28DRAFT_878188 [Melampsora americana]|nr:hypothetical protein DFH28DRAFT_878188 [Melampsora americana]
MDDHFVCSSGHCTIIKGFIQLLLFVESLNRDFNQLKRGITVKYGGNWDSVVETLGWSKERTRRRPAEVNDGRPPDTTEALIGPKKAGRPAGSTNVHRDPHSSYQSYSASKDVGKQNRCWETAALESLFPTFSPLWIEGSNGKSKDIACKLIRHFSARVSLEMHGGTHIKSVLTRGLKTLQSAVQLLSPDSFVTDTFCSVDGFIEHILKNQRNRPTTVGRFFAYNLQRDYQCTQYPAHQESEGSLRTVVMITTDLFHEADLPYSDISRLVSLWQTEGLFSSNPRCCPTCLSGHAVPQPASSHPHPSPDTEDVQVVADTTSDVPRLYERSRLDFTKNPVHVYFHLGGVAGLSHKDRAAFMGETNWPETLNLNNIEYHIVSRGFWEHSHYWCKLVRYLDGARGIWYFDDRKDDGRAQLLGRDTDLISGAQPSTSWLVYSRKPNIDEQKFIDIGIAKIASKNPHAVGNIPFVSPADLEGVEEQIEEASGSVPSVSSTQPGPNTQTIGSIRNKAKEAFNSSGKFGIRSFRQCCDHKIDLHFVVSSECGETKHSHHQIQRDGFLTRHPKHEA